MYKNRLKNKTTTLQLESHPFLLEWLDFSVRYWVEQGHWYDFFHCTKTALSHAGPQYSTSLVHCSFPGCIQTLMDPQPPQKTPVAKVQSLHTPKFKTPHSSLNLISGRQR